ncbi:MAG: hypothetical protein DWQ35_00385 [Planctomycetota bacterium]|nr:MAG: hypothetical protein DWQ35_00385 [Planctomycetota bacterium]
MTDQSSPRRYVAFDLETVRDLSVDWEPKSEDKTFPPPAAHEIICGAFVSFDVHGVSNATVVAAEVPTLDRMALELRSQPCFVTYNGRGFDFPVLVSRALKHEVTLPRYFGKYGPRYRYGSEHIDLLDQLSDYGAAPRISLKTAASLVGLRAKTAVDGSDVETLVEQDRFDEVLAYCLQDAVITAALGMRFLLTSGSWTEQIYARPAAGLRDRIEVDERLAPLRGHSF